MQNIEMPERRHRFWMGLSVQHFGANPEPSAKELDVLKSSVRRQDVATTVEIKKRVIADPGADFEHTFSVELQPEASQMFQPCQIVALIIIAQEIANDLDLLRVTHGVKRSVEFVHGLTLLDSK